MVSFLANCENVLASIFEILIAKYDDSLQDITLESGSLTLVLTEGKSFVLSRHEPSQQLWFSSPLSGGWRFSQEASGKWVSTRNSSLSLQQLLASELTQLLSVSVDLES